MKKPVEGDPQRVLWTAEGTMAERIPVRVDPELADLIPGYLESRRRDVAVVRQALSDGDFETVRRLGHNMKGTGGGYGFGPISDLGSDLEIAGRDQDPHGAARVIDALQPYLERIDLIDA